MTKKRIEKRLADLREQLKDNTKCAIAGLLDKGCDIATVLDMAQTNEETLNRAIGTLEHYLQMELGGEPKRKLKRV